MEISGITGRNVPPLTSTQIERLKTAAVAARSDVLLMIGNAGSGHVGGSLSSLDIYLLLLAVRSDHDKIIVSHGHTAAGIYAALGQFGRLDREDMVRNFRRNGSPFEGHPGRKIPGIEWTSGSLGQGLSVGCGMALAAKLKAEPAKIFVVMGDGEQAKGQLQEAREFAIKYNLNNLIGWIDCNELQASGRLDEIMPQNLAAKYRAAGWLVLEADGHDYSSLYHALQTAFASSVPSVILAHTVMGKGVPEIENNFEYHGKVPAAEIWGKALGTSANITSEIRREPKPESAVEPKIKPGTPRLYSQATDCRSAAGNALVDLVTVNPEIPMVTLDCDLLESVKLQGVRKHAPNKMIECGIQEHNAATVATALSTCGILTFWADFGVFGIDEVYSQLRMADFNNTSLKLLCTHVGLDVGEDGKTHQCIDYLSLLSNLYGFKVIVPADANQADRVIRYAARTDGNITVCMGRSKLPILTRLDGKTFFDKEYQFVYGQGEWLRAGEDVTVITHGSMTHRAVRAADRLAAEKGISVGVLNLPCPTAPDPMLVADAMRSGLIVTYEDHNVQTGLGSIIGAMIAEKGGECRFRRLGITAYGQSAAPEFLYRQQGLDEDSLYQEILTQLYRK